jgi:hypothetical protein
LVVGLDTFKPVTAENPLDHRIHSEIYRVGQDVLDACRQSAPPLPAHSSPQRLSADSMVGPSCSSRVVMSGRSSTC